MNKTLSGSHKGELHAHVNLGDLRIRDAYADIERSFSKQVESRMKEIRNMQVRAAGKNKDIKISY
jgi:hypothetical protein